MTLARNNPFEDDSHMINDHRVADGEIDNVGDGALSASYLFPAWLSSWMANTPGGDDDSSSSYHDCQSSGVEAVDDLSSSSSVEDETTALLIKGHRRMASRSAAMLRDNSYEATSYGRKDEDDVDYRAAPDGHHRHASPFAQALATWLSPYADSAKRAGRKIFHFPEDDADDEYEEAESGEGGPASSGNASENGESYGTNRTVMFQLDPDETENENIRREDEGNHRVLNRVNSSPARMSKLSNEERNGGLGASRILLEDIDVSGENNDTDDSAVIHPWTKLILLEELGTAWSWLVLLLPYLFMFIAVLLDGGTILKRATVGPLYGNRTCAETVKGFVPTPFDVSVKGYFPVPFWFGGGGSPGPCSYPFELREGVGLLSHGENAYSNLTLSSSSYTGSRKVSIVDTRYRYLMSHGHAFTSGVIPRVPPLCQSLRGSVKFSNLSSSALALVARGSVLVSAIVFQRQTTVVDERVKTTTVGSDYGNGTDYYNPAVKQWSPVLILSSKKLDMTCKLNGNGNGNEREYESSTWNCNSRRIINAFFSLPNTAVLAGGDLRVDVLLSHHETHRSTEELWFNERGGIMRSDDDYMIADFSDNLVVSKAEKILSSADVSNPKELLTEISKKSIYTLEHENVAFNNIVEATRIFALAVTLAFIVYWWSSIRATEECSLAQRMKCAFCSSRKQANAMSHFWWEDPWIIFPERRYLFLLLCCLVMLQNPLLAYAFYNPRLYSKSWFRFFADTLSGISVHGILFLWLCLVHGLRYHTAEIARRRFDQHRRVVELKKATRHIISPANAIEDNEWGRVRWYYQEYGDIDGGYSLRMKHDPYSDSFAEFMFPKISLLVIGVVASVVVAASRFPISKGSIAERGELNPDRFGSGSKAYVLSSILQLFVIQCWCIFIVYTSFVTGQRLKREPFLSTRPAQLAFRVLSSILLLGVGFSISLFYFHSLHFIGNEDLESNYDATGSENLYDTSLGGGSESWDSKAELFFEIIRRVSADLPYVGTASNIGPGKILYATACSLVVGQIFLPSSWFRPSKKETSDEIALGPDQYSRQVMLSNMDKRLQGKDKRFVVALARNTHTWRVFPLPTRSHGLMSQHTLKETLNILGTFQLDCNFNVMQSLKFGRGAIYKGRYNPVFCVEISLWLLEASWQAYYSPSEYLLNDWAPGRMKLDSIGLKLEHVISDSETDTHAFVASNVSEQVEGEEDSIIVVAFRGSASMSNVKTDLSFRQVPLPEMIMSDVPVFRIRPGKPVATDQTSWNAKNKSSLQGAAPQPAGGNATLPVAAATDNKLELDQSYIVPAVSSSAKAVIRATPMARQALPCVHEGFLENYSNIRHRIVEAIVSVHKRQIDKSVERCRRGGKAYPLTLPKLYITGHSMGGAIAQLLALDLASNIEIEIEQPNPKEKCRHIDDISNQSLSPIAIYGDEAAETLLDISDVYWLGQKVTHQKMSPRKKIRLSPPIAVYTYGQSRLGNKAFKAIYKKRVPHTFRVVTEGDAITSLPAVGPFCGGIYRHAGLEVLLDEGCTGNILVGPTVVETLLRFTKVRTSMAAHSMQRYRDSLESALGREDLKEYYRGRGGKVRHDCHGKYSVNGTPLPSWVTNVKRSHDV